MMRLTFLLLFIGAFIFPDIYGQSSPDKAFSFGIKAAAQAYGIANQNNYGQKEMDYSPAVGFAGGIQFQFQRSDRHFILVELNYQQQGQDYSDGFNNKQFDKQVDLKYITLPVLYKRRIGQAEYGYQGVTTFGKPQWFWEAGIQFGLLTSANINWEINGTETDFMTFVLDGGNANAETLASLGTPSEDKEFFNTFDGVFLAGLGFHSTLGPNVTATIGLRGGIGILDINAGEWQLENRFGIYGASRTSFLGLQIGFQFDLSN